MYHITLHYIKSEKSELFKSIRDNEFLTLPDETWTNFSFPCQMGRQILLMETLQQKYFSVICKDIF